MQQGGSKSREVDAGLGGKHGQARTLERQLVCEASPVRYLLQAIYTGPHLHLLPAHLRLTVSNPNRSSLTHRASQGIIAQTWVSLPRWKYNIHAFHIFPHILMTQSLAESHGYFFKMFSRRILNCCWIEISTAVLARNMSLELLFLASRVCVRTQFCHVARGPCERCSFHNEVTRGGGQIDSGKLGGGSIFDCAGGRDYLLHICCS